MKQYKTVKQPCSWITSSIAATVYCNDHRTYCKLLGLPGVHHHRL